MSKSKENLWWDKILGIIGKNLVGKLWNLCRKIADGAENYGKLCEQFSGDVKLAGVNVHGVNQNWMNSLDL